MKSIILFGLSSIKKYPIMSKVGVLLFLIGIIALTCMGSLYTALTNIWRSNKAE